MTGPDETETIGSESAGAPIRRIRGLEAVGWLGAWTAILAIAVWLSQLAAIWLAGAIAGSVLWTLGQFRARGLPRLLATASLWIATGVAAGVQLRLEQVVDDWSAILPRVEEEAADALANALDGLLEEGERAVDGVAEAAVRAGSRLPQPGLFVRLDEIRRLTGVTAIAIFDPEGIEIAWSGEHRGGVPLDARLGLSSYVYDEGPLFSYLYFVRRLPDGMTAIVSFLLEAGVEAGEGVVPFAEQFENEHTIRPRFWTPERDRPEAIWDWSTETERIMSVSFAELTQQDWWLRIAETGRGAAGGAALAALVVLSVVWYGAGGASSVPVLVGTGAFLLAPIGRLFRAEALYSPLQFVLPGPLDVTLGPFLVLLVGLSVLLLIHAGRGTAGRLPAWLAIALAAPVFPAAAFVVDRSAADGLILGSPGSGFLLQLGAAFLLALPIFLLLSRSRRLPIPSRWTRAAWSIGLLLPAAVALAIVITWQPSAPPAYLLVGAWALAVPFLLTSGLERFGARRGLYWWLAAGWLGGTAALALFWPMHLRAELQRAEREISLLGSRADPLLDFLLRRFAERAATLSREGEGGVNLLYHSWVESGLAREGFEARLAVWRGARAEAELNLSELEPLPDSVIATVAQEHPRPSVLHYDGRYGLHYLLIAPLPDGSVATVALPPRRQLAGVTSLARFLHPGRDPPPAGRNQTLNLVPLEGPPIGRLGPVSSDTVRWTRVADGWRSETLVSMPEGPAHAHLTIGTPPPALVAARGILLLAALLGVFFALWVLARFICREAEAIPFVRGRWLRSFRGRLSLALFVFFLLPTVIFGGISYGAVAGEVVRSATALAQQALDQAASRIPDATMAELGGSARADLLLYRHGGLVAATAPELIELGLFHSWLPPAVHLRFTEGEDVEELEERRIAESEYLVAYRRIDPISVLAAPIPLASNEIARRQQTFRDIALVLVLLGLGLSIVLSLLVSRALARPLDELSQAATTVGRGNLATRLPRSRTDEFGTVYHSFNEMVGRLDRTRAALVQETRRTETIVAEAATGVLALGPDGTVELINPRAADLLGGEVRAGDSLVGAAGSDGVVETAVRTLLRSPAPETGTEIELRGRTIRMKLRRLSGDEDGGGAVIALEDVTAELRTARVLAWGEMARQVAHEIKNPLTPIKLAVQHLRRAFVDRRPDFEEILDRNVESILQEIDRLGEISRAFSRYGTPAASDAPLEEVDVPRVIGEVLALYSAAEGVTFRAEVASGGLPLAIARSGELKEVLVNLLENAREAVGPTGEVTIRAAMDGKPDRLTIDVEDDGAGISPEQLGSIFEPHFSTRTSGTGLGLAIVRRLVDSWGGEIDAESAPGAGARFRIRLRVSDRAPSGPTGSQVA